MRNHSNRGLGNPKEALALGSDVECSQVRLRIDI